MVPTASIAGACLRQVPTHGIECRWATHVGDNKTRMRILADRRLVRACTILPISQVVLIVGSAPPFRPYLPPSPSEPTVAAQPRDNTLCPLPPNRNVCHVHQENDGGEALPLPNRGTLRRVIEYSGAVMPLMAALSAAEVGTQLRSPGTMAR
jgi:hypothetical protein